MASSSTRKRVRLLLGLGWLACMGGLLLTALDWSDRVRDVLLLVGIALGVAAAASGLRARSR